MINLKLTDFRTLIMFLNFFYVLFLFLREREREREIDHEWERGRERQNLKQALGSELSAQSLTWGSTHEL